MIVGSAAAALVGLQCVVMTLIAETPGGCSSAHNAWDTVAYYVFVQMRKDKD